MHYHVSLGNLNPLQWLFQSHLLKKIFWFFTKFIIIINQYKIKIVQDLVIWEVFLITILDIIFQ